MTNTHLVIPDTQILPGSLLNHLHWIKQFAEKLIPDTVVHLGDHWDFPSLRVSDHGTLKAEACRLREDLDAGLEALSILDNVPGRKVFTEGNHEFRLKRYINENPHLAGSLPTISSMVKMCDWEYNAFLSPRKLDGILYSHYFCRNADGKVVQSKRGQTNARVQVQREGISCTAGHNQGLSFHAQQANDGLRYGLIAGSCYLDDFDYLTDQGKGYWRGIIVKRNVHNGEYDPEFVSLDSLCREYEGMSLKQFAKRTKLHIRAER